MSKYQPSIDTLSFFYFLHVFVFFKSPFPLGYSWNHLAQRSLFPIESDYQRQHCRNKLTKQRLSLSKAIHKPSVALLVLSLCFLLISSVWRNLVVHILNPVTKSVRWCLKEKVKLFTQFCLKFYLPSYWLNCNIIIFFFTRCTWNNYLK